MLEKVILAISRHQGDYAGALYSYALVHHEGNLMLLRGDILFSRQRMEPRASRTYGNGLELHDKWFTVDDATKFIESVSRGQAELPYAVPGPAYWGSVGRDGVQMRSHDGNLGLTVGAFVFTFNPSSSSVQIPYAPLVHLEHPVFADGRDAVPDWLGGRANQYVSNGIGLVVIVPEVRGAISRVKITNEELRVETEPLSLPAEKLVLRAVLGFGDERVYGRQKDSFEPAFKREGDVFTAPLSRGIPTQLDLFLLDGRDASIVDMQEIHHPVSTKNGFVTVEMPTQTLVGMITGGESEVLELKREVTDKVVVAVAALANTSGGTVVVGVEDDLRIVGVLDPGKQRSRLTGMINELMDPVPVYELSVQTLQSQNVLVIRVPESDDAPHNIRGRGVFVRRKDQNGPATRLELDEMYRSRSKGAGRQRPW